MKLETFIDLLGEQSDTEIELTVRVNNEDYYITGIEMGLDRFINSKENLIENPFLRINASNR